MENPLAFKVGQVFTGFGFGCGVGIGVGRPVTFLRSLPLGGEVVSAGTQLNHSLGSFSGPIISLLRSIGLKSIDAGVGCGIGFGHGFGIGVTLKPSAVSSIIQLAQSSVSRVGLHPPAHGTPAVFPTDALSQTGLGTVGMPRIRTSSEGSASRQSADTTNINLHKKVEELEAENSLLKTVIRQQSAIADLQQEVDNMKQSMASHDRERPVRGPRRASLRHRFTVKRT